MSNPVFYDSLFRKFPSAKDKAAMTVEGSINKCLTALFLLCGSATLAWINPGFALHWFFIILFINTIIGFWICFVPSAAKTLLYPYAILEGFLIGTISLYTEKAQPGIVVNAVALSLLTTAVFFLLYRFEIIKVTEKVWIGITSATCALCLVYLVDLFLMIFGRELWFLRGSGLITVGVSVLAVGLAAMNLVLDFDFIEKGAARKLDKDAEYYGAFGILITLIWMYLELLRLLNNLK